MENYATTENLMGIKCSQNEEELYQNDNNIHTIHIVAHNIIHLNHKIK